MKPITALIVVCIIGCLLLIPGVQATVQYTLVKTWGTCGSGDEQFTHPWGLRVDPAGYLYIADTKPTFSFGNIRVEKYTLDGVYFTKWGSEGTGNGQFHYDQPKGIALDSSGNVWVTDIGRIEKFDSSGYFLTAYGSWGTGNGQFENPQDITSDPFGNFYIIDSSNDRVQKLDSNGNYLLQWGGVGWDKADGHFLFPEGIAADAFGNVFVVDTYNNRVQKFDSSGKFLKKWGSAGSGDGQFNIPGHITVDSVGNVYVLDRRNDRVQIFDTNGNLIGKINNLEQGNMIYPYPEGIDIDPSGNVYISDTGHCRILKYSPDHIPPSGNISVATVPPGAEIFLNNADTSHVTPFTLKGIAPGDYLVNVTLSGYVTPPGQYITVMDGETSMISFTLEPQAGGNLIINGGFEDPPLPSGTDFVVNATIPGWNIDSGAIDLVRAYWKPVEGYQSIDLSAYERGKISQVIPTKAGNQYALAFRMAGNMAGPPTIKQLAVYWDGNYIGTYSFDTTGKTASNMGWIQIIIQDLPASTGSTVISFADVSEGNTWYGVALDDIIVTSSPYVPPPIPPVPEFPSVFLPVTFIISIIGVILFLKK